MKVLFLVPNWDYHDIKFTTASVHPALSLPLEFSYVRQLLREEIEAELLDANALKFTWKEMEDRVRESKPDVIVAVSTPNYLFWRCPPLDLSVPSKVAAICKEVGAQYILLGPHGTSDPKTTLETTGADAILRGEPEFALAAYLNSNLQDETIQGLYTKHLDNGIAPQVKVEELPIPYYEWIQFDLYEPHVWSKSTMERLKAEGIRYAAIEFSRGCTFDCPFCLRDNFRNKFRKRPAAAVLEEIRLLKNRYGVRYFFFIDEIFNWPSKELDELLAGLKEEDVYFGCQARPDIASIEQIDQFAEAGCVYIEYGVETVVKEVNHLMKKNVNKGKLKEVILHAYEKLGRANTVLGFINFNSPDIKSAMGIDFEDEKALWTPKVVRPYPGTFLGDQILHQYQIAERPWEFVLKYVWWLQVENLGPHLYPEEVTKRMLPILKRRILHSSLQQSRRVSYRVLELLWNEYRAKQNLNTSATAG